MPDDAPIIIAFFIVFWFDNCFLQSFFSDKYAAWIVLLGGYELGKCPL